MKTIKIVIVIFTLFAFVQYCHALAATEQPKKANQVISPGYESKNTPPALNAIAIKNAAEELAKKRHPRSETIPVPDFSNLEFIIYKDRVDILDKPTDTVIKTYSTKDAVKGRLLFLDFNFGRDSHGMEIKGSYLIDLKNPAKVITTASPPGAIITQGEYVVYEQEVRGNPSVCIYNLETRTQITKTIPSFGFDKFLKFSPDKKYLLASSPVNVIYAIPIATQDPVLYLNIPVPQGEGPFGYSVNRASFIGRDTAKLTLANGKICIVKITSTGITLIKGPAFKK